MKNGCWYLLHHFLISLDSYWRSLAVSSFIFVVSHLAVEKCWFFICLVNCFVFDEKAVSGFLFICSLERSVNCSFSILLSQSLLMTKGLLFLFVLQLIVLKKKDLLIIASLSFVCSLASYLRRLTVDFFNILDDKQIIIQFHWKKLIIWMYFYFVQLLWLFWNKMNCLWNLKNKKKKQIFIFFSFFFGKTNERLVLRKEKW